MAGRVRKQFGSAKPLPGQDGYGMLESERLTVEAQEMEARLQQLRDQMNLESERRKLAQRHKGKDGSTWQSGSTTRGSLGRYSREARTRALRSTGHKRTNPKTSKKVKNQVQGDTNVSVLSKERRLRSNNHGERNGVYIEKPRSKEGGAKRGPSSKRFSMGSLDAQVESAIQNQRPSSGKNNVMEERSSKGSSTSKRLVAAAAEARMDRVLSETPDQWSINKVGDWLKSIKLGRYAKAFEENEISGSILVDLDKNDLDYLNIRVLAHRKILVRELTNLREQCGTRPVIGNADEAKSGNENQKNEENGVTVMAEARTSTQAKKIHWSQIAPLSEKQVTGGSVAVNGADLEPLPVGKGLIDLAAAGNPSSSTMWTLPGMDRQQQANNIETGTGGVNNSLLDGEFDEEAEHEAFRRAVMEWRNGGSSSSSSTSTTSMSTIAESNNTAAKKTGVRERSSFGTTTMSSSSSCGASTDGRSPNAKKQSCYGCYKLHYEDEGIKVSIATQNRFFCSQHCVEKEKQKQEARKARIRLMQKDRQRIESEEEAVKKRIEEARSKRKQHQINEEQENCEEG